MPLRSELIGPDYRVDRAWGALGSATGMLGAEAALILAAVALNFFDAGVGIFFSVFFTPAVLLLSLGAVCFVWGGLYWIVKLEGDRLLHRNKLSYDGNARAVVSAGILVVIALGLPVLAFWAWVLTFGIAHPDPPELS